MRFWASASAFTIAALVLVNGHTPGFADQATIPFTPDQRRGIEQIIKEYLVQNPEVLRDASTELERRTEEAQKIAQTKMLQQSQEKLVSSRGSMILGNPTGTITLVAFFDYNCPYCRASVDDIQTLVKTNPNLKVILREFPILGPESTEASHVAIAVARQFQDVNLRTQYYRSLMKVKGRMNGELAVTMAARLGANETKIRKDLQDQDIDVMIRENLALAESLGINGTPAVVIGNQLIVGAVGADKLQEAVANYLK